MDWIKILNLLSEEKRVCELEAYTGTSCELIQGPNSK
jgi:hypothetical protein